MINCGKNETQIARERQRDHGMQTHDGQDYAYYEVPSRFQVMLSTAQKYSLIVVRPLVRPRKPATDKHFGPPLAGLPGGQYSSPPLHVVHSTHLVILSPAMVCAWGADFLACSSAFRCPNTLSQHLAKPVNCRHVHEQLAVLLECGSQQHRGS